ncbi:insulin-like growth factor-binding protein complex acid labile subunit [Panonychus citri]|uniref:insulin-like growth factor-binding protein complex acid labile subunit n=1 Tax=Panonychus citri TaxID=50023 RepID=UPI0023071C16|nr:insulin-like growth factor-binding protein complex acid labile subunit [Panonychus citri]
MFSFIRFVSSFMFLLVLQDLINLFHQPFNCLIISVTSDVTTTKSYFSRINFLSPLMVNAFCPSNCHCDDNKLEAICSNATLTIVPITLNPNLRKIHLNFNAIVKLSTDSFSVYRNIEFLDLSNNKLDTLEDNSFRGLTKLKKLHLDGNRLNSLTNFTFNGLSGLQDLYLNDNLLSNLNDSVFKGLTNLKQLNLNSNRLNYLGPRVFIGLNNLRTLYLTGNSLSLTHEQLISTLSTTTTSPLSSTTTITSNATSLTTTNHKSLLDALSPRYLPNLISLHLSGNNLTIITKLNSPFFSGMDSISSTVTPTISNNLRFWNNLQELTLNGCSISSIESGSFNGLPKLTTLRIHNNNFQQVPKEIFTDLDKLEVLQIGGNPFTTINSTSFTTLTSLKSLDISRCPHLNIIESGAFTGLESLQSLEISSNPNLKYIESTLFDPLVSLENLILSHNSFSFLDPHLSFIANRIKLFDVRGNPFTCNCSVQWIRKLFIDNSEVFIKRLSPTASSSSQSSVTLPASTVTIDSVREASASKSARRVAPLSSSSSSSSSISSLIHSSDSSNSYLNELTCVNPMPLRGKQIITLEPGDMGCYEIESLTPIVIGVVIGCIIVTGVVIICGIRWRARLTGLIKGNSLSSSKARAHHHNYHYPSIVTASPMVGGNFTGGHFGGTLMGTMAGSGAISTGSRKIFSMRSHNPINTNDLDQGPYSKPECIVIPGYRTDSTTIIHNLNNPMRSY